MRKKKQGCVKDKKMKTRQSNTNTYYPRPTHGWCVDGSTLKPNPGISEYQCVDLTTKEVIFNTKIGVATNNITEFLAIIHALIASDRLGVQVNIYSDSQTAIAWTKKMAYKTNFVRDGDSKEVYRMLDEGIEWLKKFHLHKKHNKVLFWRTKVWGQIPADFGRAH
jgi:ribonuclease HI